MCCVYVYIYIYVYIYKGLLGGVGGLRTAGGEQGVGVPVERRALISIIVIITMFMIMIIIIIIIV